MFSLQVVQRMIYIPVPLCTYQPVPFCCICQIVPFCFTYLPVSFFFFHQPVSLCTYQPVPFRRVDGLKPASTCLWTVPLAQALLRGRAWVAQLWAKSVGAVRLRALPFSLVQQGCLLVGVSRCGPAAVVGRGC